MQLNRTGDAITFLEKALILSNEIQCSDNREILELLGDVYCRCGLINKALLMLTGYLNVCLDQKEQCKCMLLIAHLWLHDDEPEIAKKYLDAAQEKLLSQVSSADCQVKITSYPVY